MPDNFAFDADTTSTPSAAPFAVTPNDNNALPSVPKALYVGTGGQITLRGARGTADVVFKNVASGQTLDVRASHVRATGTTATDIVALA